MPKTSRKLHNSCITNPGWWNELRQISIQDLHQSQNEFLKTCRQEQQQPCWSRALLRRTNWTRKQDKWAGKKPITDYQNSSTNKYEQVRGCNKRDLKAPYWHVLRIWQNLPHKSAFYRLAHWYNSNDSAKRTCPITIEILPEWQQSSERISISWALNLVLPGGPTKAIFKVCKNESKFKIIK